MPNLKTAGICSSSGKRFVEYFVRREAAALVLLIVAVILLFQTAPQRGEFWWSDAPRHAMDGAFYYDLIRELPVGHIRQYAMDYYLQYPALTTLFYPPVFPLAEAVFFAVFGVSHFSAQLTVAVFYLAAAWAGYLLSRQWLKPIPAFSVSLLFVSAPEVALWGRQVMLEIPACAFLLWSSYVLFRYLDRGRPRLLYLTVLLLLAGIYTKQTVIFIAPVFALMLWFRKGRSVLRDRHVWSSLGLFTIGLVPLAIVTLQFGHVNVNSVKGGQWTSMSLFSWESWVFYLRQLPAELGWPVLVLAAIYLAGSCVRRSWRGDGYGFLTLWLAVGYIFFSFIALKEPRHIVVILFPIVFFAIRALQKMVPASIAAWSAAGLAVFSLIYTLHTQAVPAVAGYREAVDYVAARAPRNSVILFSGYRDGSFIFNLRAREDRRDLVVLRADKLLLKVTQRRELGVEDRAFKEEQISEMLSRYGVTHVVNQANFWDDLPSMQRLQRVLKGGSFVKVATIPISGNVNREDFQVEIFENAGPISQVRERIRLELPIINSIVEGELGGRAAEK